MQSSDKGSEKRRYKRREAKVEAVMTIGETTSIQCVIHDFCEEGLFLQLKQPSAIGFQKNKSAKIYFSAQTDSAKEYFQIDAQVARVAEDGIGVAFENISELMFNALKESTSVGSIAAHSNNPRFFLTSSNQEQFNRAFKDMVNINLPTMMGEFFNYAEDELEKKPDYAGNFRDLAAQANLISVLRMNKDALVAGYCRALTAKIDFSGDKHVPKIGIDAADANLSLVEKDTFEDWLNFSTLVRKSNVQYKNQLYQLELKISYVTCFPRYLVKNPIDPEQLCEYFRKEIANIEDSVTAKRTMYNAFQTTLSKHLSALYEAFDALLIEHGAPKGIAQDIVWKKNFPTGTKGNNFSDDFSPGHQLPTFDNTAYHYPESSSLSAPLSVPLRPRRHQPASQTAGNLYNLINQSITANQNTREGLAQGISRNTHNETTSQFGSGYEYSADELLAALIKLQTSNSAQQLTQNSSTLLQTELADVSAGDAHLGHKTFSSADRSKLDVYDQLFQALSHELDHTPNIKSYLESIKLPLMALTLQDPDFLDSESHPARNLLNQLFSLESAVDQNKAIKNTQIKQVLDQLVSRIGQGSIINPAIFAEANEELKEISLPVAKSRELNVRRVIEIHEGKQKLEQARQKIQRVIDNRLANQSVPNVILLLLDSGWQHLLVITELNDDDNAARHKYLEVLDDLLTWYADLEQLPEEQTSVIEMELEFIDSKLSSVCTNAFVHSKIMGELSATLLGTGTPRVRMPFEKTFVQAKAKETTQEFISDSWLLQVDQLEIGDWFTSSLEKNIFEPLSLIWIGETPPIYVFVNRDGYKKQELTRNALAELLESGVVTQIENLDEPLMNRATTNMLQQMQEKLIHSVSHDPVTNLPNRKRFINLLREQLSSQNTALVLGFLEIEDFRVITNVCGLIGGDQLLLQVAQSVSHKLGNDGLVSRLGDKSFGFLLKNTSSDEGQETAKNIRDLINKTNFVWDDKSYTISVSIGLVPVVAGIYNAEELLQKADSVNISAKRSGHNRIRMFEENDESLKTQTDIHEWAGRIDRIFSENRLFARCQMIAPIDPEKNSHSHYEILLGVIDEVGKIIVPDKFIPAVERCQRMPEIDRWIVEHVFEWIMENRASFDKIGGFAINLSGQSLNSEEFLNFLKDRLSIQDVPPEKITFEVTESVAAGSLAFTKRFIKEIKQFGCKFSLDDFGTGYSSYSYLKSLDVDYLKIDGSFIKDIANSQTDQVMVNSMNEIAHSLELETIAEYVENMNIHAILKEIGVDYAQGYGIHKPMPLTELTALLMTLPDPRPTKPTIPSTNLEEPQPSFDPNYDPDDPLADFFN
jgi:diguanylate cyclase (GGDEF)-like protein